MNDGYLLVENLITYAVDKFAVSENDARFLRLRLYRLFGLDLKKIGKFASRGTLRQLVELEDGLREFIESSYTFEGNVKDLVSEIFGILSPLPSQVERSFKSLREKMGAKAASEQFYGIVKANAYVKNESFSQLCLNDENCIRISYSDKTRSGRERLDDDRRLCDNFRSVLLDFNGSEYDFSFQKYPDAIGEGELILSSGKPFLLTKEVVDEALSFIEYLPQYALISYFGGLTVEDAPLIGGYLVTDKDIPSFSCKVRSVLRSSYYPDADIEVCNYPVSGINFVTFNRNAVVDFLSDAVNSWNTYVDEECGVIGANKKRGNRSFFSMRILSDGRYALRILFTKSDYFDLYEKPVGLDSLFSGRSYARALFGDFVIDESAFRAFNYAKSFIEKKVGVSVDEHCPQFAGVLGVVEKDDLFTGNSTRSAALLCDALVENRVDFLKKQSAFSFDEEGVFSLKKFLSELDLR